MADQPRRDVDDADDDEITAEEWRRLTAHDRARTVRLLHLERYAEESIKYQREAAPLLRRLLDAGLLGPLAVVPVPPVPPDMPGMPIA